MGLCKYCGVDVDATLKAIDDLQEENERLREQMEYTERNAAMSQEESCAHIDRIAALMDENERLRKVGFAYRDRMREQINRRAEAHALLERFRNQSTDFAGEPWYEVLWKDVDNYLATIDAALEDE